jgi:peptide/nickel transport system ATP-binding protein
MLAAGVGVLLISHDLAVVAQLADEILVMKDGRVVEKGSAARLLNDPQHPYTRRLVAAVPGGHTRDQRLAPDIDLGPLVVRAGPNGVRHGVPTDDDTPVLEATGLVKSFPGKGGASHVVVDDVSFRLDRGRTLGIVGESGSGKSTTARIALALETPDAGEVRLLGRSWTAEPEKRRRSLRRRISFVQQDPLSSFDPRWTVERILLDALTGSRYDTVQERGPRIAELLTYVALGDDVLDRFPLRLSGGQRQRVAIARALAAGPDVVVLDEAVSALDVSIQAQILDLLVALQDTLGLAYLFISHDLGVIAHMSDEVLVMKDGVVVERGHPDDLFTRPEHPYTRQLVDALPTVDV